MGRKGVKRRHTIAKALIYLSIAGTVAYLSTLFYTYLMGSPYLEIKEIVLVGGGRVDPQRIAEEAGIRTGQNILSIDLKEIKRRVESFPWVKEVMVQRLFPDRLRIEIRERVPMALLYLGGKIYIVDEEGIPFKEATAADRVDLPVITGIKGDEWEDRRVETVKVLKELFGSIGKKGGISMEDISEVRLAGEDVVLYTMDGKEISLGRGGYREKMERLGIVKASLGSGYRQVESIDLGYSDRAVVRFRDASERG